MSDKENNILLTIGMAHFDDYDGVYFTIQSLKIHHRDVLDKCELIVIDNSPNSPHGKAVKSLIQNQKGGLNMRYIPFEESTGTSQTRNKVFEEAKGEHVMCMDCHVLLPPNTVSRLLDFYSQERLDLYSGPLLYDDIKNITTHFDPVWRSEMWGIWGDAWESPEGINCVLRSTKKYDKPYVEIRDLVTTSTLDIQKTYGKKLAEGNVYQNALEMGFKRLGIEDSDEPFEIPAQGLGLFTCKKSEWLGFNKDFRGFGGEECYIHEKYRQAGKKNMCLPFLKWNHRFNRPEGVKYPLTRYAKVRNYVLGHLELGLDLKPVKDHFVDCKPPLMSEREWDKLLENPQRTVEEVLGEVNTSKKGDASVPAPVKTINDTFEYFKTVASEVNEHFPTMKHLAEDCDHITEISKKQQSCVPFLAAQPKKVVSYHANFGGFMKTLNTEQTSWEVISDMSFEKMEKVEDTDLLYINYIHEKEDILMQMKKFGPQVNKYIILGSSTYAGLKGETTPEGTAQAVREFIEENPEWFVYGHYPKQYGMTILSKIEDKRPKYRICPWPIEVGAGAELKKLLKKFGIEATPNCSCNANAYKMNCFGTEWTMENIEDIVDWMGEEAKKRNLPFVRVAAKQLVKIAVRKTRKSEAKEAAEKTKELEGAV